jgi:hypothetical protein
MTRINNKSDKKCIYLDNSDNILDSSSVFINANINRLYDLFDCLENNINIHFDINKIDMSNNNPIKLCDLINYLDNNNKSKTYNIHTFVKTIDAYAPEIIYNVPLIEPIKRKRMISTYIMKEKINIDVEISTLNDLIQIIETYPVVDNIEYNFNLNNLHKIKNELQQLNEMIGMNDLKNNILDQLIYYIQDFHKIGNGDFMHTVIYGPPGTGKTEVAKIIGNIFSKLGILSKNKFRKVTRADLVAGYLGQTALKTKDVIQDCLGGVLFIDEAYALGNSEKRDSFSKECIDTLCEALSDHKDKLMVIVAGYEEELKSCFFAYNKGLDSRFTWRFKTAEYTPAELFEIFRKKIKEIGWKIRSKENEDISEKWFEKHKEVFKFYGRDMETLLSKVKIAHSRRVFCKSLEERTYITLCDLDNGMKIFMKNDEVNKRDKEKDYIVSTMYS